VLPACGLSGEGSKGERRDEIGSARSRRARGRGGAVGRRRSRPRRLRQGRPFRTLRLARIADRRGVSVEQLEATVQARLLAHIDAAEKSGRISGERAAKLRERVSVGSLCAAGHVRARIAVRGMLRAAAGLLGLDRQELRAELPGDSLASLAAKQGKSEADLEAAMLAPAKTRLAQAVASGRLAQARADTILERLGRFAERLATKEFPA
jgi:hypothetical protein